MKPIYDAIYNIIETFLSPSSIYAIREIDGINKRLVIDPNKQFIYGTNFPENNDKPLQTSLPKNGIIQQEAENEKNTTYIFYQPVKTLHYSCTPIESVIEIVEDDITHTQTQYQYINKYQDEFNLIFYTKSLYNTNQRASFIFSDIFFNLFRGNVNIQPFLMAQKVFDLRFHNYEVKDLSSIEGQQGVSRYQANFVAKYEITTNINTIDNLKNIIIDEVKVF